MRFVVCFNNLFPIAFTIGECYSELPTNSFVAVGSLPSRTRLTSKQTALNNLLLSAFLLLAIIAIVKMKSICLDSFFVIIYRLLNSATARLMLITMINVSSMMLSFIVIIYHKNHGLSMLFVKVF